MDKHVTGYEGRFIFWSDGSVTEEVVGKSGAALFLTLPTHSLFPLSETELPKTAIDQAGHDGESDEEAR